MATHTFDLNYTNNPATTPWISLIDLTMLTEVEESDYIFNCEYGVHVSEIQNNIFKTKYLINFDRTIHSFVTNFYSNRERSTRVYHFVNYYKIGLLEPKKNVFYNLYKVYTIKHRRTLNYTFRYINNFFQDVDYSLRFYYKHHKTINTHYVFNLNNKTRLRDAGKTLDTAGKFTWNPITSKWDYEFTLANINIIHGDYVAVINNGSTYSNCFIDLKVGENVGAASYRRFDFRYTDGHGEWANRFNLGYINNGILASLYAFQTRYKVYLIGPGSYLFDSKYYTDGIA